MSDFIVTVAPWMRTHGMRELNRIEGGELKAQSLGEGLVLVSSSLARSEFIERLLDMDPIFVRHVAPVDSKVELTGEIADRESVD